MAEAAVPELLAGAAANLRGADLSRNPLVTEARRLGRRTWSDRYLSPLNGGGTVGVAVPAGQYLLIAELAPDFAREAITRLTARIARSMRMAKSAYLQGLTMKSSASTW